eukprot:PLAT5657.5.p1 GENE.PLAT5657.5~~PLAT5657.5.p1  ORF type:complete len:281 (-),score=110.75 PLAT5657.5:105-947(-)
MGCSASVAGGPLRLPTAKRSYGISGGLDSDGKKAASRYAMPKTEEDAEEEKAAAAEASKGGAGDGEYTDIGAFKRADRPAGGRRRKRYDSEDELASKGNDELLAATRQKLKARSKAKKSGAFAHSRIMASTAAAPVFRPAVGGSSTAAGGGTPFSLTGAALSMEAVVAATEGADDDDDDDPTGLLASGLVVKKSTTSSKSTTTVRSSESSEDLREHTPPSAAMPSLSDAAMHKHGPAGIDGSASLLASRTTTTTTTTTVTTTVTGRLLTDAVFDDEDLMF